MNNKQNTRLIESIICKNASKVTRIKNISDAHRHGVADKSYSAEYVHAACGCCKGVLPTILSSETGKTVWDQKQYAFLKEHYDIDSEHLRIHPALWNNGTNNLLSGLFEVLPGKIYQVRGYDMANITFVKTNNIETAAFSESDRWMVMDTLMSTECTEAALKLFDAYINETISYQLKGSIAGMIISHSHVDHYGGMSMVKEWFTKAESLETAGNETNCKNIPSAAIPFIIAPEDFVKHSISENVYVGNAMARRASYQYGTFIKPSYDAEAKNHENDYLSGGISIGIGQGQSTGTVSIETPTVEITENQKLMLDELTVEFQLTPGTEAPTEMNNYFADYKALWLAENCSGTLHNLYTLRGAQVRDGKDWAKFLVEAAVLYGDKTQVIFQSHNWPHWNYKKDDATPTDIKDFMLDTASIYKYINDQTLYYMNQGYKMNEASDMLTIPRKLQKNWCTMPFYGTPKHNAKAVYQKYLGWYDANPLHLEELPPEQLAREQMRYMMSVNDSTSMIEMIKKDINTGNYWTAAYMAHQMILGNAGEPDVLRQAKSLCADALEQLGYQAQSGTWRNSYLCAAYELRHGKGRVSANSSTGTTARLTTEMILDYISILFDGEKASSNVNFNGELHIDETGERFAFIIRNGAIMYYMLPDGVNYSDTTVSVKKATLLKMLALARSMKKPDLNIYQLLKEDEKEDEKISKEKNCECEIDATGLLSQIADCMVNLSLDRYKYFDIIGKHDSEVLVDDTIYDLLEVVSGCIGFLDNYRNDLENGADLVRISDDDLAEWKNYYNILMVHSDILPGMGKDGTFKPHEYWYTMYSLYHYLGRSYVNNDSYFRGDESMVSALGKLKKKIQLLESYLPDFYFSDTDKFTQYSIELDTDDKKAWKYLCEDTPDASAENFYAAEFFKELYECYKQLDERLGL